MTVLGQRCSPTPNTALAFARPPGTIAQRIDHIGSTSVPDLGAKPIIDIQTSVAALEPHAAFAAPHADAGYVFRASNAEPTNRYFREPPGTAARTHLRVRQLGTFTEQFALLSPDSLRSHPDLAAGTVRGQTALGPGSMRRVGQEGVEPGTTDHGNGRARRRQVPRLTIAADRTAAEILPFGCIGTSGTGMQAHPCR